MTLYENVKVFRISESGQSELRFPEPVVLRVDYDPQGLLLSFMKGKIRQDLKNFLNNGNDAKFNDLYS